MWSAEEDRKLVEAVTNKKHPRNGRTDWSEIAKLFPGKVQSQCKNRYRHIRERPTKTGKWSPQEHAKLEALVENSVKRPDGRIDWTDIARPDFLLGGD